MAETGSTVASVAPSSAGWACDGANTTRICRGSFLFAEDTGITVAEMTPNEPEIVVSVSVSHALADVAPANNAISATLPVEAVAE